MINTELRGFSPAWTVESQEECWFYHCMDLPDGESIESGTWDMRGKAADYFGKVDLRGKSVLDIGTASGFLSFSAEQLGASRVVGFDAWAGRVREPVPVRGYRENKKAIHDAWDASMIQMKRGFWYSHRKLRSSVEAYYGDIYDLPDELGLFDVAIIGQILTHLKHPLSCIEQVVQRVKPGGELVIVEGHAPSNEPIAKFIWTEGDPNEMFQWWHMSEGFYLKFLHCLDCKFIRKSVASYILNLNGVSRQYELPSLVFKKRG